MPLYHQTDEATAEVILRTQEMKPGSGGLAGAGIYFAADPGYTGHKAHRRGVILEARVDVGRYKAIVGSDPNVTLSSLRQEGYDSIRVERNVGSGQEYVVYEPWRVRHIKRYNANQNV